MPRTRRPRRPGFYEPEGDHGPFGPQERTIGAETDPRELVRQRDARGATDRRTFYSEFFSYDPTFPMVLQTFDLGMQEIHVGFENTRRVVLRTHPPEGGGWEKEGMTWRSPLETAIAVVKPITILDVGVEPDELAAYVPGGSLARGFLHLEIEQLSGERVREAPRKGFKLDITDLMNQHLFGDAVASALEALRRQGVPKPKESGGDVPGPPEAEVLRKQWLVPGAMPSRLIALRQAVHAHEGECLVFYVEQAANSETAGLVVSLRYLEERDGT